MAQIIAQDDSLCLEVAIAPGRVFRKFAISGRTTEMSTLSSSSSSPIQLFSRTTKRKTEQEKYFNKYFDLQEKKMKLQQEIEKNKQRRHEETTEILKKILEK
ncbi:uncharacterized protein LOC119665733 [Teleopsis dalmanni]|uniref:uncharacterized protein LOC119665733 n=1 Tax=Teleopsis dalmanni TaxID=139649 RepID=UPI0018CCC364|nr:uncharacterized protein LOC119665733 [Teleopsis dalmanni]